MATELSPAEQLVAAVRSRDVARVRALLEAHAELVEQLDWPLPGSTDPAIIQARGHLPLLDLLLEYGADINAHSEWWAGSFGILHWATPAQAPALIARGAEVDVFAAAHLGQFGTLRAMIEADPALIAARGPDGQTPLHFARTPEIAGYLLDRGAAIDARDVDHESTPAQFMVTDRPEVARYLISRGAWFDIFLAAGLGDLELARRCVEAEPDCLNYRIGQGLYKVRHDGAHASTPEQIGDGRGDIYRWSLHHDCSPQEVAARFGHREVFEWLLARSSPTQQLLAACAAGDESLARAALDAQPDLLDTMTPDELGRLAYLARDRNQAGVALMLQLGFPVAARGQHGGTALHWSAWRGDLALVETVLGYVPPLELKDTDYQSTPLGWAVHASCAGWDLDRADDYGPVVARLLAAGCQPTPTMSPCRNPAVEAALRQHGENQARP